MISGSAALRAASAAALSPEAIASSTLRTVAAHAASGALVDLGAARDHARRLCGRNWYWPSSPVRTVRGALERGRPVSSVGKQKAAEARRRLGRLIVGPPEEVNERKRPCLRRPFWPARRRSRRSRRPCRRPRTAPAAGPSRAQPASPWICASIALMPEHQRLAVEQLADRHGRSRARPRRRLPGLRAEVGIEFAVAEMQPAKMPRRASIRQASVEGNTSKPFEMPAASRA